MKFYHYNRKHSRTACGQMSFEYNASGKIKKVKYPNGVVTDYSMFDPQNQSIEIKNPLGALLNINIKKDLKGLTIERGTRSGIEEFKYDTRSQLISAKYGPKSFHYSYDLWGNRITGKTEGKNTFSSYAPEGKILTRADTLYSWDNRGNLISRKNKSEETKFVYDFNNRLIKIYGHGGKSISYHYDAGGKLVSRTANGETAYYLYTGQNPIVEVSSNGNVIRKYLYGPEIDQIFGMEEKGHKYYFHRDERNNVVLITDEKGAEVASYKYDPFGNLIEKKDKFESQFLFSGHMYEPLFNLYYMRNRFYDPETGRFISRDPLPGNLDNALSANPYIYVGNNPMNHTDPLGLEKNKPPSTFLGQAWSSVTGFGNAISDTVAEGVKENIWVDRTTGGEVKRIVTDTSATGWLRTVLGGVYSAVKTAVKVHSIVTSDAPRNEKLNAAIGWLGGKAFDALAAGGAVVVGAAGVAALPLAAITSWTQGQVTDLIQETLNLKDAFKDEDAAKARAREALNTLLPDVFKAQVERAIAEGNFVEATRIAEQMQDFGEGIGHMGVQADAIDLFDTAIEAERRAHADKCPNDPNKTEPGICGCDVSDIDSDKDGTPDCNDKCPNDPNRTEQCIASVEEQRETLVRNKDCSMYKNTFAKWDDSAKQPRCFCKPEFTFKYKQGCVPKSGGVIYTKKDPECSSYISSIKGNLQTGDKNVLKLLAGKAKNMGCSDPVIDQVLKTGGVVTGGGGDDLSGCKNIGYIDIEFQGKRIKQAVCNDDPGGGVTGDRGNTGNECFKKFQPKFKSLAARLMALSRKAAIEATEETEREGKKWQAESNALQAQFKACTGGQWLVK